MVEAAAQVRGPTTGTEVYYPEAEPTRMTATRVGRFMTAKARLGHDHQPKVTVFTSSSFLQCTRMKYFEPNAWTK